MIAKGLIRDKFYLSIEKEQCIIVRFAYHYSPLNNRTDLFNEKKKKMIPVTCFSGYIKITRRDSW